MPGDMPDLSKLLNGNMSDILLVANPDIGCEDVDPTEGWSHKDYFQVKWDGRPHRIAPGQTKRFPRWLALHYAKHLADHLLMKEEEKTGKRGLVQSPVRRPQVLATILLSVDEYFGELEMLTPGQQAAREVEALNASSPPVPAFAGEPPRELGETDVGAVPPPALGELKPEPPAVEDIMRAAGRPEPEKTPEPTEPTAEKASIWDPSKPKPTRIELLKEAIRMGIDVTGWETVDELTAKLRAF